MDFNASNQSSLALATGDSPVRAVLTGLCSRLSDLAAVATLQGNEPLQALLYQIAGELRARRGEIHRESWGPLLIGKLAASVERIEAALLTES